MLTEAVESFAIHSDERTIKNKKQKTASFTYLLAKLTLSKAQVVCKEI